jgi:hypothetical protein
MHARVDMEDYERAITGRGSRILRPTPPFRYFHPEMAGRPVFPSAAPLLQCPHFRLYTSRGLSYNLLERKNISSTGLLTMEADTYDHDSTFGDGSSEVGGSTTTSIRSAITKYEFEHGRRYHAYKSGQYFFPNDESELERMDIEHHNQGLQLGALHLAPLHMLREILDLGTGSGIWVIDMADKYPSAVVIGTDLSPMQPSLVPPNVRFEVDDF